MAQLFVSGMAHFFVVVSGSKIHERVAHFFIDIYIERRKQTIFDKIIHLNEEVIKGQIKELVRGSVEETLNELLEAEADRLTQAARYERNEQRQGYRSGHYSRNLTTTAGDVTLKVPRLKGVPFETAIIERYRRREAAWKRR